ncbi:hypothetical protein [Arthrobacter sp. 131MFCol6.1]|uniref:hypothetical protein n=1 Tax=Arthrobacter sp. 131MFCol6.1 TaxID=1157944 RepID=UPI0003686ADD|nr:hypothetical protein [Arthrobacter sp. 131MFCol6.1]
MTARGLRFVRGWAAAVAATFIAALSHVLSGGPAPETSVLVLSLALSGLVCTALAGRVLSLWRLCTAVVVSQGLFHGLFSLGSASSAAGTAFPAPGHAGHTVAFASGSRLPGAMAMDQASPLMWAGHALAALATIVVLRHGEVTAVRLIRALGLRVVAFLPFFLPLAVESGAPVIPADWPVRPLRNLGAPLLVMRHRGPPRLPVVS